MVTYIPAQPDNAAALAELRVTAMKPSLEAIGRFDPERARSRFLENYDASHTTLLYSGDVLVGFFVVVPQADYLKLDHLYVLPQEQGKGIGADVLNHVKAKATELTLPIRLGALRESPSNKFYLRNGFSKTHEDTWDIYYEWFPVRESTELGAS